MDRLDDFRRAAADPLSYARQMKNQGHKLIGFFCSYAPEELIFAAGLHPLRLFGSRTDISRADAHLQSYCCSLARGALEAALAGDLDFLDGTVFPHTCDSIQRLSDVWRLNTNFGFFADIVLPVKLNTGSAQDYFIEVLAKFIRDLERWTGRRITDQDLAATFSVYNRIRSSLMTIAGLRSHDPSLFRGRDYLALVKGAMVMDRRDLADRLPQLIESIERGDLAWDSGRRRRLVLAGGICDHPEIYDVIEESGGVVVADDLCTGSRWFEGSIGPGQPLAALSQRYLDRSVCPAKHTSLWGRGEHIVKLVKEHRADGVIFLLVKFCDPHSFDYPYMKDLLDREKIPHMLYEVEAQLPSVGQLTTRFETFMQML